MRAGIAASARVAPSGVTATFQASAADPANSATYTFSALPIGAASATRRVVVAVGWRDGTSVTSATIGGVSATIDAARNGTNGATIVSAVVPTGTTANVTVNLTGTATRAGIGVWTLTSGAPTGQTASDATDVHDLAVTTATGDVVIGVAMWVTGAGAASWTGATERYDEAIEGSVYHSGADAVATGTTTTLSASVGANGAACAAAYA